MNGGVIFLIILIFLLLGSYIGWVVFSRIQANRLGLPPPSLIPFKRSGSSAPSSNYPAPAPGGIRGFIDTQMRKFKNRNNRYAAGAYEESGYAGAGAGATGRGAGHRLDPDEAWDARVGNEAYYEEQELGLHAPPSNTNTGYAGGSGYGAPSPGFQETEPERGRSRTREYDDSSSLHADRNPFGDENAASLRGVSPRPLDHGQDTSYGGAAAAQKKSGATPPSPTESTRRSVFRENM